MAEDAARRLQSALRFPAWALSVLVFDLGNNDCELRVWLDEEWSGPAPLVPQFFDGFHVTVEARPKHAFIN